MKRILLAFVLILTCPIFAQAQVPVALLPDARQQFLDVNGHPLAGGQVFFYAAGTTTPQATYVDITGTIQNTNPLILDSGGYGVAYLSDASYKVCVEDANSVQQWCQDGVNAFQAIAGPQFIIFSGVTSFPAGSLGELIYRTDLGRFCFFNSSWDCLPGLNTIDTLTNKTISINANTLDDATNTAGTYPRNNGTQYIPSAIPTGDLPATLSPTLITLAIANAASTGTTVNLLAKLTGAPSTAVLAATTDTNGLIGICVSGCGTTGSAEIATSGITSCVFDNSSTAGDYVTNSNSVAGDCHDNGTSTSNQIVGRVLATAGPGLIQMYVFPPAVQLPGNGLVTYSGGLTYSGTPLTLYVPFGGGYSNSNVETDVQMGIPAIQPISNLHVILNAAPGAGNAIIVTLRDTGSNESLTCTVSGGATRSCSDNTDTYTPGFGSTYLTWSVAMTGTLSASVIIQISAVW